MSVSEDWIIYFFMYTHFKELWSITSSILSFVNKNTQVYLGCSKFLLWSCLEIKQQSNILIRKWFCIYDKIYKKMFSDRPFLANMRMKMTRLWILAVGFSWLYAFNCAGLIYLLKRWKYIEYAHIQYLCQWCFEFSVSPFD
jgi:hypothetical protein